MTFMEKLGLWLMVYAVASMLLAFVDINFRILMWMEAFGTIGAWLCRVALLGFGFYLYRTGDPTE